MLIFAGLGNPGTKYAGHRHNIGFMAVERIAARHRFGPWRSRFQASVCEGEIAGTKLLLVRPQTFMNESGRAVAAALRFYKLPLSALCVFYDELDLAPGKLRVKTGGGAAGHNGIRSITAHLGADFQRVRLGIGHPGHKEKVTGHVLGDFAKADADWLEPMLDAVAGQVHWLARGAPERFATAVAQQIAPQRSSSDEPTTH